MASSIPKPKVSNMLDALRFHYPQGAWRVPLHALAVDGNAKLLALSVVAHHTQAKALHAALTGNMDNVTFEVVNTTDEIPYRATSPSLMDDGYKVRMHRLPYDQVHVVALSEADGVVPAWGEDGLWRELTSERYTTPVLRSWIPWLKQRIEEDDTLLSPGVQWQCATRLLTLEQGRLDEMVSWGLNDHCLRIARIT